MNNLFKLVPDSLNQIAQSESLSDLNTIIFSLRETTGVANIVYHAVRLPGAQNTNPILILTYEQGWVKQYSDNNYFIIDPVVALGKSEFLPIDWSNVDRRISSTKWFFAEAEKHGVGRQGITLPIRGPWGERALFTVTSNLSEMDWTRQRLDYIRNFQIIGHLIHDRAVALGGYRSSLQARELSPREQQCLSGIIDGQSPKQIAASLGLSASAVQLYLKGARHKLECKSTSQAAAKYSMQ